MGRRAICLGVTLALSLLAPAVAHAAVPWAWPVTGPILRGFDPPDDPYGAGHRGIDIATAMSTVVVAPDGGVVTFAGKVGGRLFVTIDHGGGLMSTASWLTAVMVHKGDRVTRGQPVALTGWGHAELTLPHLHFGARLNGTYVDPMAYLEAPSATGLIRLAPLESPAVARDAPGRMTSLAYPTMARAAPDRDRGAGPAAGVGGRVHGGAVGPVPGERRAFRIGAGGHARAAVHRLVERRRGHR